MVVAPPLFPRTALTRVPWPLLPFDCFSGGTPSKGPLTVKKLFCSGFSVSMPAFSVPTVVTSLATPFRRQLLFRRGPPCPRPLSGTVSFRPLRLYGLFSLSGARFGHPEVAELITLDEAGVLGMSLQTPLTFPFPPGSFPDPLPPRSAPPRLPLSFCPRPLPSLRHFGFFFFAGSLVDTL